MVLSKGGVRAYAFLKRGLSEGIAPTQIAKSLIGTPLKYSYGAILRDLRELGGLMERSGLIRYVPKRYRPSKRILATAGYKQTKPFLYEFEIGGYNRYTMEHQTLKRKMGMEELMAVGAAEEIMVGLMKTHGFITERIVTVEGWMR